MPQQQPNSLKGVIPLHGADSRVLTTQYAPNAPIQPSVEWLDSTISCAEFIKRARVETDVSSSTLQYKTNISSDQLDAAQTAYEAFISEYHREWISEVGRNSTTYQPRKDEGPQIVQEIDDGSGSNGGIVVL
jgi:hypothetical protein